MSPLFALPIARLTRAPRAWGPIVGWAIAALFAAWALRAAGVSSSGGDAIQGPFGAVALPLLAWAITGAVTGGEGLGRGVRPLVALGADPGEAAGAGVAVGVVASAGVALVVGVAVAWVAHGPADPPLGRDVVATGWIAALGGAAYAALFAFGASFGRRGSGRVAALLLDAVLGAGDDPFAFATPRAHARSLLGGEAVGSAPSAVSAAILVLLALVFAAFAVRRASRLEG